MTSLKGLQPEFNNIKMTTVNVTDQTNHREVLEANLIFVVFILMESQFI